MEVEASVKASLTRKTSKLCGSACVSADDSKRLRGACLVCNCNFNNKSLIVHQSPSEFGTIYIQSAKNTWLAIPWSNYLFFIDLTSKLVELCNIFCSCLQQESILVLPRLFLPESLSKLFLVTVLFTVWIAD